MIFYYREATKALAGINSNDLSMSAERSNQKSKIRKSKRNDEEQLLNFLNHKTSSIEGSVSSSLRTTTTNDENADDEFEEDELRISRRYGNGIIGILEENPF